MATVNRFYNPQQTNRINPISFEELAYAPTRMRQMHDQTEAIAAENAVNQADALAQDEELARSLYAPIEQKFNETINSLSKNGFSHDLRGDVTKLIGDKKRLERDKISKIEARTASYRANVAAIQEQFKDDPEVMKNRLNALAVANKESSKMVDGQLHVPGIKDVFRADMMSSDEKLDFANKAMDKLKPMMSQEGITWDGSLRGFTEAYSSLIKKGVGAERIRGMLTSALGLDAYNSFKMEGIMQGAGYGGKFDAQIRKGLTDAIPEFVAKQHVFDWYTNHPKATAEDLKKEKELYKTTDKYKEEVAKKNEAASTMNTEEYYAQFAMDEFVMGVSNSMAYEEVSKKYWLKDNAFNLANYKNSLENQTVFPPTLPGIKMNTETISPLYGETFSGQDEYGVKDALLQKDNPIRLKVLEEHDLEQIGRYTFATRKDGTKFKVSDSYVHNLVRDREKKLKNAYTNPKVRKYVDNNESLTDYVNEELQKVTIANKNKSYAEIQEALELAKPKIYGDAAAKVNNFYKNIGSNYNLGIALPSDVVKEVKNLYRGKMGNFKIVHPEKGQMTFEQFLDDSDLEASEFYETFNPSMSRNVHGNGNMLEVGYMDSDDKEAGIFVEPPLNISVNTQKSAEIDKMIASGDFKQPLEGINILDDRYGTLAGKEVQEYITPNFNTGRIMIRLKDIKTGKFIGQYDFQSLLSEEDNDANKQWRTSFELEGKAN